MTTPGGPEQHDVEVVRSEEQLQVGSRLQDAGRVLVRKLVGSRHETHDVERNVETAEIDSVPAEDGDTGEVLTLADGTLSIPVFEERVFVEKRLVVRERILVRKTSAAHREQVAADVRVEHVEIEPELQVHDRVDAEGSAAELVRALPSPGAPAGAALPVSPPPAPPSVADPRE